MEGHGKSLSTNSEQTKTPEGTVIDEARMLDHELSTKLNEHYAKVWVTN